MLETSFKVGLQLKELIIIQKLIKFVSFELRKDNNKVLVLLRNSK